MNNEITLKQFTDEPTKALYFAICQKYKWLKEKATTIDDTEYPTDYYRILKGEKAIGFISIQKRTCDYCVCFFYIDGHYRGKGYGTQALEKALKICWDDYRCISAYCWVEANNYRAVKLYCQYGFLMEGDNPKEKCVTFFLKRTPRMKRLIGE